MWPLQLLCLLLAVSRAVCCARIPIGGIPFNNNPPAQPSGGHAHQIYTYVPINIRNDDTNYQPVVPSPPTQPPPTLAEPVKPTSTTKDDRSSRALKTTTTAPDAASTEPALCRATCFDPPCNLLDGTDPQSQLSALANRNYEIASGRFQNVLTGIRSGKDGPFDRYLAVYMYPNDIAGIDSGPINLTEDRVLEFDAWENTNQLRLQVCVDSLSKSACPYITSDQALTSFDDRQWLTHRIAVPAGTKRVMWMAKNTGTSHGAVGLDNITWLKPDTNNPDDLAKATPICNAFAGTRF